MHFWIPTFLGDRPILTFTELISAKKTAIAERAAVSSG
jgi:hypothetical protein